MENNMTINELMTISKNEPTPLIKLSHTQLIELQTALVKLGYPAGEIDGKYGHNTKNAWAELLTDSDLENDTDLIDKTSLNMLQQRINAVTHYSNYNFTTKEGTIEAIKNECINQGICLKTQIAYVLATADHETNHTFKPVIEAYWLPSPDNYLKTHLPSSKYYPYYGRGYVQLTWDYNYEKYGRLVEKDLLKYPEKALDPEVALFVLVHGFKTGAFTGRKIADYINEHITDFINARRCINGIDKAKEIAELAQNHLNAL